MRAVSVSVSVSVNADAAAQRYGGRLSPSRLSKSPKKSTRPVAKPSKDVPTARRLKYKMAVPKACVEINQ